MENYREGRNLFKRVRMYIHIGIHTYKYIHIYIFFFFCKGGEGDLKHADSIN